MRKNRTHKAVWGRLGRGLAGILVLALVLGLLPEGVLPVRAAGATGIEGHWAASYMEQLVEWDVMRGDIDGNLAPDRSITRAEFVTLINRAYGYKQAGKNPFTDVTGKEWYADDIATAYNVGYFQGTSANTASPNAPLTREQAALLLARNMMLRENPGEVLDFTDGRAFSDWSRGMIQAITAAGIINGYPDGSFRPRNNVTRGEAATMLTRAIGSLISTQGVHSAGSVYGNLTINTAGVTLRDTVVVGDLYLTGGIGLGDVLLENVTVIGQIIVSGAGESNSAQSSIILRNVTASGMIVDSINNQFVTVRAEGDTDIATVSVRTNAYVEDASAVGFGMRRIELDGENGTQLQLAGNIKEVVNLTPSSKLEIVQGAAQKVTIDEKAVGSAVTIDIGARIDDLNLDVASNVSGAGDVGTLNVGASGSTVTMLPDVITIRPGVTASIAGTTMDSATAAEWSTDPRLLAGYPNAKNIAVAGATLVFSTNKAGTVYWALTALSDGSVSAENVINPPASGGTIIQSGSVKTAVSKTEYTAKTNKLTSDGSYYISAIMVDSRGNRSPLKVAAFSVPDSTVPAFAKGYPTMTKVTTATAQVTVMTNKSCMLYYALLPAGSTAPTEQEFKANAISGNLGYGTVDMVKNVTQPINVNAVPLDELTKYELYLWLTDYDGAKSSKVGKLEFTTPDETPPVVTDIMQTNAQASSAEVTYTLNEPGTLYWAIVAEGNDTFMNYALDSTEAKVKVESGVGALKKGTSTAAKADTDVRISITGLNTNTTHTTSYTLYYVAKDKEGNYSEQVRQINVRTLDTTPPTVTQEFTSYNGEDVNSPLADTDIRLVFSEGVRGGTGETEIFMDLYNKVLAAPNEEAKTTARNDLASALRAHIKMYYIPTNGRATQVDERTWTLNGTNQNRDEWCVDYRFATVSIEDGKMVITLPTTEDVEGRYSALNLKSGATYYFRLEGIYDNALTPNPMGNVDLPQFRTVYAQISMSNHDLSEITVPGVADPVRLDMCMNVEPISTSKVDETECWDMILWSDTSVSLQVYRRVLRGDVPQGSWSLLGDATITVTSTGAEFSGISLYGDVITTSGQTRFDSLKASLEEGCTYQYGIHFTQVGDLSEKEFESWSNLVTMRYAIIAGGSGALGTVAGSVNRNYDSMIAEGSVTSVGVAYSASGLTDILTLRRQFTDRSVPSFLTDSPKFTTGSSAVHMELALDREGTIYYVVAPANSITTSVRIGATTDVINTSQKDGSAYDDYDDRVIGSDGKTDRERAIDALRARLTYIPTGGADREKFAQSIAYMASDGGSPVGYTSPTYLNIVNPRYNSEDVKTGTKNFTGVNLSFDVTGLKPSTPTEKSVYYVYFVLQGGGETYSPVECYRFTMGEVQVPSVSVDGGGTTATMTPDDDSQLSYTLVELNSLPSFIRTQNVTYQETGSNGATVQRTMNVLTAMMTPLEGGAGKTYFDEYATTAQRNDVVQYILGSVGDGTGTAPVGRWTVPNTVLANVAVSRDFEEFMTSDTAEYVVLAAARHIYGGTDGASYGFGAIRALYKPDKIAPEYSGGAFIQPGGLMAKDSAGNVVTDWSANPQSYRYSGTFTVTFSKEVYLSINNERYAVWATNQKPTGTGSDGSSAANAVSVIEMLGGDVGGTGPNDPKITVNRVVTRATNSFTFRFENVTQGTVITFFDGGLICNGSTYSTPNKLVLTFDTSLTMESYGGLLANSWPGFRVTWGGRTPS